MVGTSITIITISSILCRHYSKKISRWQVNSKSSQKNSGIIQHDSFIASIILLIAGAILFLYFNSQPVPTNDNQMTPYDDFEEAMTVIGFTSIIVGAEVFFLFYKLRKRRIELLGTQSERDYNQATDNYFFKRAKTDYSFAQEITGTLTSYDYQRLGLSTYHNTFCLYRFKDGSICFEPTNNNQHYYLININFHPQYRTSISGGNTKIKGGKMEPHFLDNGYNVNLKTESNPIYSSQYEVPSPALLTLFPVGSNQPFNIQMTDATNGGIIKIEQHFLLSKYSQRQLGII